MTEPADAANSYASTVVAPVQIALGVVTGIVAGAILLALGAGLRPFAALALVLAVGVGIYLAVVSLRVEPGRVTLGQGRGEREQRTVYASELVSAEARRLSWAQCFGVGMPDADRTTRLSVRAGDALVLITRADELIVISTPDAQRALQVLISGTPIPAPSTPAAPIPPVRAQVSAPRPRPIPPATTPPTTNPRPRPRPRTGDAG